MTDGRTNRLYREELTDDPGAPFRMRRIVTAHLRQWGCDCLAGLVSLAVSEMLSNVCKHAGSPTCVVTLEGTDAGVRLTVSDASTRVPVIREPDWSAESGRGMCVIATLAHSYGWFVTAVGKDVWAEFRADSAETAA